MKKFLQNIVRLKKISTIKDFRFGLHILPTLKSGNCTFQLFEYISTSYYNVFQVYKIHNKRKSF